MHINILRKELYPRNIVYVRTDLYTLPKIHSKLDCCGRKTNVIKPEVVIRDHVISRRLKRRRPGLNLELRQHNTCLIIA